MNPFPQDTEREKYKFLNLVPDCLSSSMQVSRGSLSPESYVAWRGKPILGLHNEIRDVITCGIMLCKL